jgi:hypothetical protein
MIGELLSELVGKVGAGGFRVDDLACAVLAA